MSDTKTTSELKKEIKKEIPFVDIKPFSHNIIGMCLSAIAKLDGDREAKKTITELGLDKLGW